MKFRNQFEYQTGQVARERFHWCDPKKDMTVPDQSISIKDMIERFVRGEAVNGGRPHYYDEMESFENVDPTLDPDFGLSDYAIITNEIQDRKRAKRAERAKQEPDGQDVTVSETVERPQVQARHSGTETPVQEGSKTVDS